MIWWLQPSCEMTVLFLTILLVFFWGGGCKCPCGTWIYHISIKCGSSFTCDKLTCTHMWSHVKCKTAHVQTSVPLVRVKNAIHPHISHAKQRFTCDENSHDEGTCSFHFSHFACFCFYISSAMGLYYMWQHEFQMLWGSIWFYSDFATSNLEAGCSSLLQPHLVI